MDEVKRWLHTNDATGGILCDVLGLSAGTGRIVLDGDCGSVWGEYHQYPAMTTCPHPHVLLKNPTPGELVKLVEANIAFTVSGADWSEHVQSYNWTEDPECPYRTIFVTDYRRPYEPAKEF
jgi:hypothetical protein